MLKNRYYIISLIALFLISSTTVFSQETLSNNVVLNWNNNAKSKSIPAFDFSVESEINPGLSAYHYSIALDNNESIDVNISNIITSEINTNNEGLAKFNKLTNDFEYTINYLYNRGEKTADIKIEAYRENENSSIEKLISFTINTIISKTDDTGSINQRTYATNSVLASGDWYKLRIPKSGIYKVSGSDMQSMGFSISGLDINHIHLHGNGGGMLPEANSIARFDDIEENAIKVIDQNSNGIFDADDYFIFYGKGPTTWKYYKSRNRFLHKTNIYDDYAYYFVTINNQQGKRITLDTNTYNNPNISVNSFTDYALHENDSLNLIKSGKQWFGEHYSIVNSHNFNFNFPNIVTTANVLLKTSSAARSTINSTMYFNANGKERTIIYAATSSHYLAEYATPVTDTFSLQSSTSQININSVYSKPSSSSQAWLDYIAVNARRHLIMYGGQMKFCDPNSVATGNTAEYTLQNANVNSEIWDITTATEPMLMNSSYSNNTLTFVSSTDSLKQFIAHHGGYLIPTKIGSVSNQNLHSLSDIDYIIIYDSQFESLAERLAEFHRTTNNLSVYKTTLSPIYNEFASGSKDNAAIRDFMKMLYDKAAGDVSKMPKYLLFFGDASYDYKNRIVNNTNLIPTYESNYSLSPTGSYCTDDFFGLLDDGEGSNSNGDLDVGIGRFPVTNYSQALAIVDKIINYKSIGTKNINSCGIGNNSASNMADWRNKVCFIGDDEDGGLHTSQADYLANYTTNTYPVYNVDKIFFDAYPQIITPGGQRYPEVKRAINQTVDKGTLIMNYTGHGGELGWAHESVLEISDINSWTNSSNLPLFITATCEFSRYDDPERISAGEYVLLNSKGGGIALLTTSRVAWSSSNFALNKVIFKNIFEKTNGEYPTLGDIVRLAKIGAGSIYQNKNFLLLGDPAMRLTYPSDEVVTINVTDTKTGNAIDTISALQKITIHGEVHRAGVVNNNFNGKVDITIFDKTKTYSTLGNDPNSPIYDFKLQKSIIYKGKAEAKNGVFDFDFVVPKDIAYNFGLGKISYYASNDTIDANGYSDTLIVGGSYDLADSDDEGPYIELFMNNRSFRDYGITDENPKLLAYVFDEHGINTIGNGIGHDLTAIIDGQSNRPIVLNEFYEANIGDYTTGIINYPFYKLENGEHSLDVKVWDVYNNSATASINFIVANNSEMAMDNLFNQPNPFTDKTSIVFEHNQGCEILDVEVLIFNNIGALVRKIETQVSSSGYRIGGDEIVWDGTSSNGAALAQGVYVYQLRYQVRNADGSTSYKELSNKMVLLK
ncbi:MAG: hypothetical protein B6I18_03160 [Bacteroidetes bacterium 4572_112]|nr:MAG: hypothetical protein B6I18_03160 [Bacteroidetes bacterium 4572_112]